MSGQLVIERLEFQAYCGLSEGERSTLQPLAVDVELDYELIGFDTAAATSRIRDAVDYSAVAERAIKVGQERPYVLLETMADEIAKAILAEFPVVRVSLWIRKTAAPLSFVSGSVGVRLTRNRTVSAADTQPAAFLAEQYRRLPMGRVLDLAAGRGRNTLFLAERGYRVEAIDRDESALNELRGAAERRNLLGVSTRGLDLEAAPPLTLPIPANSYEAIVVFYYLHRPLFPLLLQALRSGGVLMYETFLVENHVKYHHPRRREFCLEVNELLSLTAGLQVLHYDEGERRGRPDGATESSPSVTARLIARKP
jgi:dihydroneopterin aldolase